MNDVIQLLMSHRSIRKFTDEPIPDATLHAIIRAAQMASTSSNVQAYSVITVQDQALREQMMKLSGDQQYVAECPVFLVWCADLYRLSKASGQQAGSEPTEAEAYYTDTVENFIVATVDTALAAQNAVIAAESLGLGAVYIGGLRNNIEQVSELLRLPELVYPLFGMCLGVPAQSPMTRPRLPLDSILHTDTYQIERTEPGIESYDRVYAQYMHERSQGKVSTTWSSQMRKRLQEPIRLHMKSFLESKGFIKR